MSRSISPFPQDNQPLRSRLLAAASPLVHLAAVARDDSKPLVSEVQHSRWNLRTYAFLAVARGEFTIEQAHRGLEFLDKLAVVYGPTEQSLAQIFDDMLPPHHMRIGEG
jgi:hypothetical protein